MKQSTTTTSRDGKSTTEAEEEDDESTTDHDELIPITACGLFNDATDDTEQDEEEEQQQQFESVDQPKHEHDHQHHEAPHDNNGLRKHGLPYFALLVNFLKSLIGVGFLSLPNAFRLAGIGSSLALLLVYSTLNCYCMMLLVDCAQFHYKRLNTHYLSYGTLGKEVCKSSSFPWLRKRKQLAKYMINASVLMLEFGFCSTFYLFIAQRLEKLIAVYWSIYVSIYVCLLVIYVPMVLLTYIRSIRILSFFSLVGNVLMFSSLAYILYAVTDHLVLDVDTEQRAKNFDHHLGTFSGLLIAGNTMNFSFEAHTLVLPLEKKSKKPQQMKGLCGVMALGVFIAFSVYATIGFLGYMSYGCATKESITDNLDQKQIGTVVVTLALCLSLCSCFLLEMYVIVDVMWSRVARTIIAGANINHNKHTNSAVAVAAPMTDQKKRWWQLPTAFQFGAELCFRTLMVTLCLGFAVVVPKLEDIIPLVSSVAGMLLAFVYPALIDLFTFVPLFLRQGQQQKAYVRLCQDIVLAGIGLFGMVAGLYASINALVNGGQNECDSPMGTTNVTTMMPMYNMTTTE